jgi:hypothetical protein
MEILAALTAFSDVKFGSHKGTAGHDQREGKS